MAMAALLPPLIFTGNQKLIHTGEKTPADFVRAIEQRAAAQTWDDKETMNHAITCLQGDAANWLYGSLKLTITPEEWNRISTSWTAFLGIFKARYQLREVPAQTDLSGLRKQQLSEPARTFMDRITRTFGTLIGKQSFLRWAPALDTARLPATVITAINATDETKQAVANELAAHEAAQEQHTLVSLIEAQAKATIASGLRNEHAQQAAYAMMNQSTEEKKISLLEFQQKILEITERKDNLAKSTQAVRAINASDSDLDDDLEGDNAVEAIKSGRGRRRNRNKKKGDQQVSAQTNNGSTTLHWSRDPNRNPNFGKQCDYCGKYNHVAKDCYKKKREDLKKTKQVAATQETKEVSKAEVKAAISFADKVQGKKEDLHLNF